MKTWLNQRARIRYARSFREILSVRKDAIGIAAHLRHSFPLVNDAHAPAYSTFISRCTSIDLLVSEKDSPPSRRDALEEMMSWHNAVSFGVRLVEAGKSFTVYVVEDAPAADPVDLGTADEKDDCRD
jgi:hypothetical protein